MLQQGPGDAKPLLLPAGDVGAALLDIGVVLVGELLDKGVRLGQLAHPDHLLVSGVLFAPAEIILDGAGEQHVLLQHHGHLVPQGVHIVVPDVRAAHQDAALSGVVQTGDQLDQGGLGGAGAAQDTYGLTGLHREVHVLQALLAGVLGVGEADVLKHHGAVLDLFDGLGAVLQIALLVQDLCDPLCGGPGHDDHSQYHGEHHQAHQHHHDVAEHTGQLAGGHAAAHDQVGADPGHGDHAGIHTDLHQRHIEGQDALRLGEVHVDLLGDLAELLYFMVLPNKGLHHPDAQQVLLHHVVQVVIALEDPFKNGVGPGHDERQADAQDRDDHQEDQCQLGVDAQGEYPGADQHDGGPDRDTDDHHKSHLDVGHVCGQAGDDAAGGELVNVGKGELLDIPIHLPPQIPREARRGLGAETAGQSAADQRQNSHSHHGEAVGGNMVHAAGLDPLVQQLAGHQGDQHVKRHFADDEDGRQDGGWPELLNTAGQAPFFLHRIPPCVFAVPGEAIEPLPGGARLVK